MSSRLTAVQRRHRNGVITKLARGEFRLEDLPVCLCGEPEAVMLASTDRFGLPVGAVACTSCGLARTSPRLAAEDLPAFYERHYHGLHQGVDHPDPSTALFRPGQGRVVYRYVERYLPAGRLRVADIGCGTGQVLREFIAAAGDRAIEAQGCEYASAFVDVGRAAGSDLRRGGPETLDGPFDVVILSHVVEHFADVLTGLRAIRDLTVPSTVVYVEVPGVLTIHEKPEYSYRFAQYLTLAHTFHFTLRTLVDTMARGGFALVDGDEVVRSVFRPSATAVPLPPDDKTLTQLLEYLEWLRRSPSVWVRRTLLGARPLFRGGARVFKRVFGERAYARLRRRAQRNPTTRA